MKYEDLLERNNLANDFTASQIYPYRLIVRQSHKLGRVATKAFHDIGRFLLPAVSLPRSGFAERLRKTADSRLENRHLTDLKIEVRRSHEVLAIARGVFPLSLFPDSVVVDRTKVTIIYRTFFWSSSTMSFRIEDILNVSASVGPFFGSLTIASRVMSTVDHFQVKNLWRADATALKHIIQGYIIAKQSHLETGRLSTQELVPMLSELGIDSDR